MPTFAIRTRTLVVTILAGVTLTSAARAAGDRPISSQRIDVRPTEEVSRWAMPHVDVPALLEEDRLGADRLGVPERIGFPVAYVSLYISWAARSAANCRWVKSRPQ